MVSEGDLETRLEVECCQKMDIKSRECWRQLLLGLSSEIWVFGPTAR